MRLGLLLAAVAMVAGAPLACRNAKRTAVNPAWFRPCEREPHSQLCKPPVVLGYLPWGAVKDVIDAHRGQVRTCYARVVKAWPSLKGRVMVNWVVAVDGRVTRIRLASTTMHDMEAVEYCVARAIRAWKFPPEYGGNVSLDYAAEINYPFTFPPR